MKSPPNFDALSWEIGRIHAHIFLVKAGVRPVAEQMVQNKHIEECVKTIKKERLMHILDPRGKTHTSIYMFKQSYLKHIVNFILNRPYNEKTFRHWINGKVFGYSDEEINGFIKKHVGT